MDARALLAVAITRAELTMARFAKRRPTIQYSGLADDTGQAVELFLPYGQSALPTAGEVIVLRVAGRTHRVALMADDSGLRITDLTAGEFGWRDVGAQQVVFRSDRIEVTTGKNVVATVGGDLTATVSGTVTASAGGGFALTGNVKITGNLTVTGDIADKDGGSGTVDHIRAVYDTHTHGGILAGAGNTAAPNQPL